MNDDVRQVLLTVLGVLFAKAVDIAWDAVAEKRKTPRRPGKHGKRS